MQIRVPLQFHVPLKPLTLDRLWRGGPRFKTKEYLQYQKDLALLVPKGTRFDGEVDLTVEFFVKNKRADLDNLLKAFCDVLTNVGVYNDDSQIVAIHAHKCYAKEEGMRITLTEA